MLNSAVEGIIAYATSATIPPFLGRAKGPGKNILVDARHTPLPSKKLNVHSGR